MKKILIPALAIALTLTACQKPADDSKSQSASESATQNSAKPTTAAAPSPTDEQTHDHPNDEHHDHGEGDHDHDHHDHADHAHDHDHAHGDAYQCGDKTAYILVDSYEGETEVRLTQDDITYDLSEDVQTKGRFTTDDSIVGDDKGMALVMTGNQAKITTLDDKLLLDCVKK